MFFFYIQCFPCMPNIISLDTHFVSNIRATEEHKYEFLRYMHQTENDDVSIVVSIRINIGDKVYIDIENGSFKYEFPLTHRRPARILQYQYHMIPYWVHLFSCYRKGNMMLISTIWTEADVLHQKDGAGIVGCITICPVIISLQLW